MNYKDLKEFYLGVFEDSVIVGVLLWAFTAVVFWLISLLAFYVVDSCFLESQLGLGVLVEKWVEPSHHVTTYIQSGKVMVPVTHYIPEHFNLRISIRDLTDVIDVSSDTYNRLALGQKVNCDYILGRISGDLYINSIQK